MPLLSTTTDIKPEVEHGCAKVIPGSFEKRPMSSMTNHGLALCCSDTSRARPFSLGVEQTKVSQGDSLSAGSCICPPALLIDWGWHVIHQKNEAASSEIRRAIPRCRWGAWQK